VRLSNGSRTQLFFVEGGVSVLVSVDAGGAAGSIVEAFALNSFLQLARNFIRSGPCRPFASACFEHSMDSGDCTLVVFAFESAATAAVAAVVMAMAAKIIAKDFMGFVLQIVGFLRL